MYIGEDTVNRCFKEHPVTVIPQQITSHINNCVDMGFAVAAMGFIRRQIVEDIAALETPFVADFFANIASDIVDVVTAVAIFRETYLFAA